MPRPSPQTDRIVAIMNLLSTDPYKGRSLSEIAVRVKQDKTSLYPMLTSLQESGFIKRNKVSKKFTLGPAVIHLGEAAKAIMPVEELAREAARKIYDDLEMHSFAFAFTSGYTTLIEALIAGDGYTSPRLGTRTRLQMPTGALSVAWASEAAIRDWSANHADDGFEAKIDAALALVRTQGFSFLLREMDSSKIHEMVSQGKQFSLPKEELDFLDTLANEMPPQDFPLPTELNHTETYQVSGISAPIFDNQLNVVAALTVCPECMELKGADIAAIGRILVRRASAITELTGGIAPGR